LSATVSVAVQRRDQKRKGALKMAMAFAHKALGRMDILMMMMMVVVVRMVVMTFQLAKEETWWKILVEACCCR
jgi:hypothetical protein